MNNTNSPAQASAMPDVSGTTKGMLIPIKEIAPCMVSEFVDTVIVQVCCCMQIDALKAEVAELNR